MKAGGELEVVWPKLGCPVVAAAPLGQQWAVAGVCVAAGCCCWCLLQQCSWCVCQQPATAISRGLMVGGGSSYQAVFKQDWAQQQLLLLLLLPVVTCHRVCGGNGQVLLVLCCAGVTMAVAIVGVFIGYSQQASTACA